MYITKYQSLKSSYFTVGGSTAPQNQVKPISTKGGPLPVAQGITSYGANSNSKNSSCQIPTIPIKPQAKFDIPGVNSYSNVSKTNFTNKNQDKFFNVQQSINTDSKYRSAYRSSTPNGLWSRGENESN